MITSKKKKQEIIDSAWNRYTFNDTDLPDWFRQYRDVHLKKEAPVPKVLYFYLKWDVWEDRVGYAHSLSCSGSS